MSINLSQILLTDTFGVWIDRTNEIIAALEEIPVLGEGANNVGDFEVSGNTSISGTIFVDTIEPQNIAGDLIDVKAQGQFEDAIYVQSVGLNGSAVNFSNSLGSTTWSVETATDHSYLDITNGTNYLRVTNTAITGSGLTISDGLLPDTISANITGNVNGNVTGDVTGDLSGDVASTGTSTFATLSATNASITNLTLGGTSLNASANELNTLVGISATVDDLNRVSGLTSNAQTQIDSKADNEDATIDNSISITGAASDWKFSLSGNDLVIQYGATTLAILDTSGNLTVKGDVTAFGSI